MGPTDTEVLSWFCPQPVEGVNLAKLERLRLSYESCAQDVLDIVPQSADRTTALRELASASRTAVFAFTHNQEQ